MILVWLREIRHCWRVDIMTIEPSSEKRMTQDCSAAPCCHSQCTLPEPYLGLFGNTVGQFQSSLPGRIRYILLRSNDLNSQLLVFSVAQGTILSPTLFIIYTLPADKIIHSLNAKYHLFTVNSHLFLSCEKPNCHISQQQSPCTHEACITHIRQ